MGINNVLNSPFYQSSSDLLEDFSWWRHVYPYRRKLKLESLSGAIPANHPVETVLSHSYTTAYYKVRSDLQDIQVLYRAKEPVPGWHVLPKEIIARADNSFTIRWLTYDGFDGILNDGYYIYYGNKHLLGSPIASIFSDDLWPVSVGINDFGVSYMRPGEDWINGRSSTTGSIATFVFVGQNVRIRGDFGNYGIAEIQLDSSKWIPVSLYNQTPLLNQTFYSSGVLTPGNHTLRVRVSGRADPSASTKEINITGFDYKKAIRVTDLGEQPDPFLSWSAASIGGLV